MLFECQVLDLEVSKVPKVEQSNWSAEGTSVSRLTLAVPAKQYGLLEPETNNSEEPVSNKTVAFSKAEPNSTSME